MSLDIELTRSRPAPEKLTRRGTVYKKSVGTYFVHSDGQVIACAISNKLRKELVFPIADPTSFRRRVMAVEDIDTVDPVAVGDEVHFISGGTDGEGLAEGLAEGLITEVLPRRNKLARLAAGKKPLEQVIVSNVDQVIVVVAAAHPDPKWNLLDRYLVSAEASRLSALVCVTKLDLLRDVRELRAEVDTYRKVGYRVILTSTLTGEGVGAFKEALQGRVSVLVGKSGVGKSTLLNTVEPGLGLRVSEVSRSTDKGRHTTSSLEMFALRDGGSVVDTPGMREFGLWEAGGTDIALLFPELRDLVGTCQFGLGCSHAHEPGCAVRRAVGEGRVSARRYESLLKLSGE